jgi:hypothetical protein
MKLGELISDRDARHKAMRSMKLEYADWLEVVVYAQSPFTKDSEVALSLYVGHGKPAMPSGFDLFASIGYLEDLNDSFDDQDDPTQALIDYVVESHKRSESAGGGDAN